jgi:large subunit ribosomal protein L9
MVQEAILDQLGVDIDRRKIETHGPIKEIGPRVIDVAIYREVKAQVTVEVVADGAVVVEAVPTPVIEVEDVVVEGDDVAVEADGAQSDAVAEEVAEDLE